VLDDGHYGHRLAFDDEGYLWISSGDRQKFTPAQDMQSNMGKILRLHEDGSIPEDNPFVNYIEQEPLVDGVGPYNEIWSLGHRNPLGMDFDADFDTGLLVSFAVGGRYRIWDTGPWSRVGIRVELEGLFGYTQYDRSVRGAGPTAGDGDLFEYGLMFNIMPDVKLGRLSLFAGGGIGASLYTLSDSSPTDYEDSRGALALQVMAGASFELAEPVSLYAMLRYRTFSNIHFYDEFDQRMRLLDLDGAALEVGLEFRF